MFSAKKMGLKVITRIIIWGIALFLGDQIKNMPPEVSTLTIGGILEGARNYLKVRFGFKI